MIAAEMRRPHRWRLVGGTIVSALCAGGVAPARHGTEITATLGAGQYEEQFSGCDSGYRYQVRHGDAGASFQHRFADSGLALSGGAAATTGRVTKERQIKGTPTPHAQLVGRRDTVAAVVFRAGYHWSRFGIEGGAGAGSEAEKNFAFPSFEMWTGKPTVVYGYLSLLGEVPIYVLPVLRLGIGHAGEKLRASLAIGSELGLGDSSLFLEADWALSDSLRMGLGGALTSGSPPGGFGPQGSLFVRASWRLRSLEAHRR